jgi:hypothetical protein
MGWLTTLGTLGGAAVGGPWGAAAGGAIGGGIEGHKEQKAIDKYNEGQAEAGKYSPWTGVKANYNYKKTGALDQAAMGGAKGYMMGGGLSKMMGGADSLMDQVQVGNSMMGVDSQMGAINAGNLQGVGTALPVQQPTGWMQLQPTNMLPA